MRKSYQDTCKRIFVTIAYIVVALTFPLSLLFCIHVCKEYERVVVFRLGHLVPTGTGLKAWLFAAIKMCVPQFPVAPDLQGQVTEAMNAMQSDYQGVQREKLASLVSKLLQTGGALDLKKWVSAIDLTADRAGFILAHDLAVSAEVMRATEDGASVPVKERMKEVVLFSVSEEYFAIREKLQVRIDS